MKTTTAEDRKHSASPSTAKRPRIRTRVPHAEQPKVPDEPEEGAGNNDERELPEEMREQAPPQNDKRPPTNAIPDRPEDPASPTYKEPNPHDRILNN